MPPSVFSIGVGGCFGMIPGVLLRVTRSCTLGVARMLARQYLNGKHKADRNTENTTPKQFHVVEEPIFKMEHVEQGNPRTSF